MPITHTFTPPVPPDIQSSVTFTARTLNANFGEGYEQVVADGLNNVVGTYTLNWGVLSLAERDAIEAFFVSLKGAEAFYYWFPGDQGYRKFRCKTWTRGHLGAVYTLRAELKEVFDL